jgi:hypothetical protein
MRLSVVNQGVEQIALMEFDLIARFVGLRGGGRSDFVILEDVA